MHSQPRFFVLLLCSTILGSLSAHAKAAPLVSMEFGRSVVPSPVQSGFVSMGGVAAQPTQSATFGAFTVDLAGQGFFNNTTAVDLALLDPSNQDFYRDFYFNNSNTTGVGVSVSITGVTPNTPYNLTVWSYDPGAPSPGGVITWSPLAGSNTTGGSAAITNARTPAPTMLLDPAHSATISLTSTTSVLQVFGTRTAGTNGGTRLNGFKLDDGTNDLLAVDFGIGGPPSPVQSGFAGGAGVDAQASFNQVEGAYTVSLTGQGFFNTTSAAGLALLDPSVRDLYRDYYFMNGTSAAVQLSIEGVTPDTDYDLTVWSYDADNTSATATNWTPNLNTTGPVGAITNLRTPAPTSIYDPDNTTTIRVRSTSTTLNVLGTRTSGNGGVRINAIELNAVPEPSAILLAGIGLAALVALRWGRNGS
jgi:hypothetical protein